MAKAKSTSKTLKQCNAAMAVRPGTPKAKHITPSAGKYPHYNGPKK